jgi:hypothetical protein
MKIPWLAGGLVSVVFVFLYQFFVANMAVVEIQLETTTRTLFKLYYADQGQNWSERKVGKVVINPTQQTYVFRLADISRIDSLRIDPSEKPAEVIIRSIVIRQPNFADLHIDSVEQFNLLHSKKGIADLEIGDWGFKVAANTADPQLVLDLPEITPLPSFPMALIRLLVVVIAGFLVGFLLDKVRSSTAAVVPSLGLVILVLIVIMAHLSTFDRHPDEYVHVEAAKYYKDHHLPPAVGDPAIAHTYSKYGFSRLHSGEIVYFLAGKFIHLLEPFYLSDYFALRLFNISIFAVLLFLAAVNFHFRILFIPFLLSPQLWYIFSYFNSEAFALLVSMLIAYQAVVPQSTWNRLLGSSADAWPIGAIFGLGFLLSLLLLAKMNFYFFGLFLVGYFLWRIVTRQTRITRFLLYRLSAVAAIALLCFGAVRLTDQIVNDFNKKEKIVQASEQYSDELFRPSTPLNEKYLYMYMKDRGVKASTVWHNFRWGEKIFRTSFGEYGYTSVAAPFRFYDAIRVTAVLLMGCAVVAMLYGGGMQAASLLGITLACALGLTGMAFYHAWSGDFQAQGRYLLPIVGMVSILIYHQRHSLANLPCLLCSGTLYVLSVYSFIFVALAGLT